MEAGEGRVDRWLGGFLRVKELWWRRGGYGE